jgi:hypothetical protein
MTRNKKKTHTYAIICIMQHLFVNGVMTVHGPTVQFLAVGYAHPLSPFLEVAVPPLGERHRAIVLAKDAFYMAKKCN